MPDSPLIRCESQGSNNKLSLPSHQVAASHHRSDALPGAESRRHPRPKLSSYLTGQRSRSNLAASSNPRADTTSTFGLPSWQCSAIGQEPPSPVTPAKVKDLLESVLKHVLANPLQALPVQFNSGLTYIIEGFQDLEDELNRSKDTLNKEMALRQAAEHSWAAEKKGFERQIESLQNYFCPRQDTKDEPKSQINGHANQRVSNGLRGATPGVNGSGKHRTNNFNEA